MSEGLFLNFTSEKNFRRYGRDAFRVIGHLALTVEIMEFLL